MKNYKLCETLLGSFYEYNILPNCLFVRKNQDPLKKVAHFKNFDYMNAVVSDRMLLFLT